MLPVCHRGMWWAPVPSAGARLKLDAHSWLAAGGFLLPCVCGVGSGECDPPAPVFRGLQGGKGPGSSPGWCCCTGAASQNSRGCLLSAGCSHWALGQDQLLPALASVLTHSRAHEFHWPLPAWLFSHYKHLAKLFAFLNDPGKVFSSFLKC